MRLRSFKRLFDSVGPETQFEVSHGEDPDGIYVGATVDVADTDEVMDLIVDRLLDIQVEQQLPAYVVPVRPRQRVIEDMRARADKHPWDRAAVDSATLGS